MTELEILEYAYLNGGFTTRSDFTRANTEMVAKLACLGFLTTVTPRDGYGSVWRLTVQGLTTLADEAESLSDWNVIAQQEAMFNSERVYDAYFMDERPCDS
jgi:hypothetical protein